MGSLTHSGGKPNVKATGDKGPVGPKGPLGTATPPRSNSGNNGTQNKG
jgi:hypothetical protein